MRPIRLILLLALALPYAAAAQLWTCVGCSNTAFACDAMLDSYPELDALTWDRSAAGSGGSIDRWYDSILGQTGRRNFAVRYEQFQERFGQATDVILQGCIRQSPIPSEPTAQQRLWHGVLVNWLREASPGVRIHFLPLPEFETDCRGGSDVWPVHTVGLELALEHMGPGDRIMPLLPPYTGDNTRQDGCHATLRRQREEGDHVAAYILGLPPAVTTDH